ncbi:hypothetical protein HN695_02810 [Candidatus Woesearchaeota archaeon]|jgi:hypothetical protein|nr:hypothetical protein [Candidatus Woesearchaeota archaeon]MBT5272122.1 hypothetical protein [Candidatus Woesearchaeota archaeon]MBT6040925.1 hypothetical protein [Candidatus Woesearchaeota archaeon]MBT6336259.1 hypothetical protein [Candidatus Woesearchaeota archaeon]MBT7927242.1 hypothetical protein [Candidatus Woesearchaeota archaeon]
MTELNTFLDRIVERQSSFVLFGGRVYDIVESNGSHDFIEAGQIKAMDLVPSMSFSDFENLDESLQQKEIEIYCGNYVKETIDQELREELEVRQEKTRLRTLKFIMTELLPLVYSRKYDSNDLLLAAIGVIEEDEVESPVEKAKKEIHEILTEKFGLEDKKDDEKDPAEEMREKVLRKEKKGIETRTILGEKQSLRKMGLKDKTISNSYLGEVTALQPMYILDGVAYQLELVKRSEVNGTDLVFNLNGKTYKPSEMPVNVSQISNESLERRKRTWRISALERSQDAFGEIKDKLKTEDITERQMHELAKLNELDLGTCGFVMNDGSYYVYSRTPKIATQDSRNGKVFWPYDETRIAIHMGWDRGKPYSSGKAKSVEQRKDHPCMYKRNQEFSDMCTLDAAEYARTPMGFVKKLDEGVRTFFEPLNTPSLERHTGHSFFGTHIDRILLQGSLTRKEAEKQGYQIIEVLETKVR